MYYQEIDTLLHMRAADVVFIYQVTALCVKWRHDRHLESMTSYPKSDSVNSIDAFYLKNNPASLNFIPIQFETTEP